MADTWFQVHPFPHPTGSVAAQACFDEANGVVVLFGGDVSSSVTNRTWIYDGTNWTEQFPSTVPPARYHGGMAFDQTSGKVVMFGGEALTGTLPRDFNDTWSWDGTDWTLLSPGTSPSGRWRFGFCQDLAAGGIVMYGGFHEIAASPFQVELDETWTWDGADWTLQAPASNPGLRHDHRMVYSPGSGAPIMFGGIKTATLNDETWKWSAGNWTQLAPAHKPSARSDYYIVDTQTTSRVLLFGGSTGPASVSGETWKWDGSDWTQLAPTTSPAARANSSGGRLDGVTGAVLFGGSSNAIGFNTETWLWNPEASASYTFTLGRGQIATIQDLSGSTSGGGPFLQERLSDVILPDNGTLTVRLRPVGVVGPAGALGNVNLWLDDGSG